MRLIDAGALMKIIREHDYPLRSHFNSTDNGMFTIGVQQAVDEAPTIDAVPVVRCGECEYGRPDDNAFEFDGITPLIRCSYMTEPNRPHEYCSWGRRKERNIILKINYEINAKNQRTDCQFDFSAFNYPIIITNIGNCNKEEIKDMFMKTMDTLFEQAWDKRS